MSLSGRYTQNPCDLLRRRQPIFGILLLEILPSPFAFQVSAQQEHRKQDEVDDETLRRERVSFESKQIEYGHQDQPKEQNVQHLSPDESTSPCRLRLQPLLSLDRAKEAK